MPPKDEGVSSGSPGMPALKLDSREVAQKVASFNLASDAKQPRFSGRSDTEGHVESWIRTMERFGKANEIDNDRLLQVVPMYLVVSRPIGMTAKPKMVTNHSRPGRFLQRG